MNSTIILLGSNMDERLGFLQKAVVELQRNSVRILKSSLIYESAAWGFCASADFLNQALLAETDLEPLLLLQTALLAEQRLGRVRTTGTAEYASRCIDIDILGYEDLIINNEMLIIPHPRLHLRRFTLIPLSEIAPYWIHPVFSKNVVQLLQECPDTSVVRRYA